MRPQDIARNIDPVTRTYIDLAVEEAIQPLRSVSAQMHGLSQKIDQFERKIPKPLNPSQIQNEVSHGLHAQIQGLRQEVLRFREEAQAQIDAALKHAEERIDAMIAKFDSINLRLDEHIQTERYEITRAQVMRILRETEHERKDAPHG